MFRILAQIFTGFGELFPDLKTRRLVILCIGIFLPLLFLVIDSQTNLFFFWYLQKKVNILKDLYLLNSDISVNNQDFNDIYAQVLNELNSHKYFSIYERSVQISEKIMSLFANIFSFRLFWKFVSGSLLGVIVTIAFIVQALEKKEYSTDNTVLGGIIFTFITGILGAMIPIIFSPVVNYIGYPVIQILFLILIAGASSQSDSSNSVESQSS